MGNNFNKQIEFSKLPIPNDLQKNQILTENEDQQLNRLIIRQLLTH